MVDALRSHLLRLLVWAVLSLFVGVVLRKRPFGAMTLSWGAINLLIALASLRGEPPGPGFRPFLAFNLGLDVGYVGVGLSMALLAGERERIRGFGWAIVVQGAVLAALDTILWFKA